jgi:zinc protease
MMGAEVNNGTSFGARGLARDFSTIVAILADGEMHPSFSEPWLSLERDQMANSIDSEHSVSGVLVDRAYSLLLSASDDPSLRTPTPESVRSITREDLRSYARSYWRPDLATISIAGDVTPDQVRTVLETAFAGWKPVGPTPDARSVAYPTSHGGHEFIRTDGTQVYVRLGQPAMSRNNPDYDTLLVLNQILGAAGAFESRLWQELRQKRGLVYSVNSEVVAGHDRGDFRIEMNASSGRVVEAVKYVREELRRFQTQPVSSTELAEAKLRLVSDALLDEAGSDGQVSQLLDIQINGLPLDYYRTLNDRFAHITAADVQRVAETYLAPDRMVEIFAGPTGPWSRGTI